MQSTVAATAALFGCESELRLIDGLIDRVRDRGASLVLSGQPGIGKSACSGDRRAPAGAGVDGLTARMGLASLGWRPGAALLQRAR